MSSTSTPAGQQFEVPVRSADGKEIEKVRVDSGRLDIRVRPRLLKEAVLMYQANKRVGTHETKTRSFVAASNKKPWRQKGTGRARAGTRRSPIWRGGGIIFGPHPRDYSYSLPKKMRGRAVRSALFAKFRDGQVIVVDGLKAEAPKTKVVADALKALGVSGRCLLGTASLDKNLVLSARNIPGVHVLPVADFNALEILTAKTIVLTRDAFAQVLAAADTVSAGEAVAGGEASAEAGKEVTE